MGKSSLIRRGEFRGRVLLEDRRHLVDEVRTIATALQRLEKDIRQLGARQAVKAADEVVSMAREVLNMWWRREDVEYLREVQKAAVAVAKAADTNQDLTQTVAGARAVVEKALQDMGQNLNDTGGEAEAPPFA